MLQALLLRLLAVEGMVSFLRFFMQSMYSLVAEELMVNEEMSRAVRPVQ